MPPKKKSSRAAQLHPQAVHSDYDTDTAQIPDTAAMIAPPPMRTNTELNLAVLRRYVPTVEQIIAIAPFAVVYLFSPETQQWEKSGHEGTLFVCQLSANEYGYPRYNVIMLNRKSLDNFVTELVSGDNVEITEQYVILQVLAGDGTPDIYGLWIFSDDYAPHTRQVVANAIQECAVRAEMARPVEQEGEDSYSSVPSYNLDGAADPAESYSSEERQANGQQIDVLSLFGKPAAILNNQQSAHYHQMNPPTPTARPEQPSRFVSNADTDFFRTPRGPASAVPQSTQAARPAQQQNALLDLFRSASKG